MILPARSSGPLFEFDPEIVMYGKNPASQSMYESGVEVDIES